MRLVVCKTWFSCFLIQIKDPSQVPGQYSWADNRTAVNFDWKIGQISVNFTSISVQFGCFQLTGYFVINFVRSKLTVLDLTTAHLWVAMFVSLNGTSMVCYQQWLIARYQKTMSRTWIWLKVKGVNLLLYLATGPNKSKFEFIV